MPKTQPRQNVCLGCGTPVTDPYKTWELAAPFPNKKRLITVRVFGMYKCPKCGKNSRRLQVKPGLWIRSIEL